jgi:hypothetical protein
MSDKPIRLILENIAKARVSPQRLSGDEVWGANEPPRLSTGAVLGALGGLAVFSVLLIASIVPGDGRSAPSEGLFKGASLHRQVESDQETLTSLGERCSEADDNNWKANALVLQDPRRLKRARDILKNITLSIGLQGTPPTLRLLDLDKDGFVACANKSFIYLGRGFLDDLPSDAELTFVLSHEVAHTQLNHFARLLVQANGERILKKNTRSAASESDMVAGIVHIVFNNGKADYFVNQEREADLLGVRIALTSGGTPDGIRESLTRGDAMLKSMSLQADPKISGSTIWKSRSPSQEERRTYIEKAIRDESPSPNADP